MFFSSCGSSQVRLLRNNCAEYMLFRMASESDGGKCNLICGYRESEYVINGVATDRIEYGVLTFDMYDIDNMDVGLAEYTLMVGDEKYSGVLLQNPYDNTLICDIKCIINRKERVVAILNVGDYEEIFALNNIDAEWKVDTCDVFKYLSKKYTQVISNITVGRELLGEVYVKIVSGSLDEYYLYGSIVTQSGETYSIMIDPKTTKILAVNIK